MRDALVYPMADEVEPAGTEAAPGLVDGSVYDRKAGRVHRFQCGIDVIHFDRRIGNGRSHAAFAC